MLTGFIQEVLILGTIFLEHLTLAGAAKQACRKLCKSTEGMDWAIYNLSSPL